MAKKLRRIALEIAMDGETLTDAEVKALLINSLRMAADHADLWDQKLASRILLKLKAAAQVAKVELV